MRLNRRPLARKLTLPRILLLSAVAVALSGSQTTRAAQAQELGSTPLAVAPLVANFACTVNGVASFGDANARIHVRCAQSQSGVTYFAYPDDPAHVAVADQMLAVANTAFALGKTVYIYYDTNSADNPAGCNGADCRLLLGISMV